MRQPVLLLAALCLASIARGAEPSFSEADLQLFERKLRPILIERCHGCHAEGAKKVRGGLRLDSREALLNGGDSGPALLPGQPDKSLLIEAVRYQNTALQMPPKGKLPAQEIAVLEEWVRRGAPFPASTGTAAKKGIDVEAGRAFWSFQPLREPALPAQGSSPWVRGRIDAFLLAQMRGHGLEPSPAASRRALIRRATFDLTGLPPTPEEVEAFVNDPAADAYPRQVERLLASPHYGERWGRTWLDLARYCDAAEPWSESKARPHLYRDWVVRAFNEDMPYDRFVQLQLAADRLPGARHEDGAALGFLGLSPVYWKELKLDKEVIKAVVAEEWEERIGTLTSTFLGLTVACARCHDHKFDPITQADYYALAGVLASTRQVDRLLLPESLVGPVLEARRKIEQLERRLDRLVAIHPRSERVKKDIEECDAQIRAIKEATPHYDAPLAPGIEDASLLVLANGPHQTRLEYRAGVAQDMAVHIRGNPTNTGPVVPRRFLAVLSAGAPRPFKQGSGRLELARAIVGEGAPLAARVMVNRVWLQHFGAGLVTTPSDFGSQGARPSHPELLEDLAARFVAHGWSLKWLHREILLSAAYQQSSQYDARKQAIDPDNRWLARMSRRRLDIESWRDAMLAVSDTLSRQQGGPAMDLGNPRNNRRTLYGLVRRRELHDMLRLNDFPDPTTHSAARLPTTTALQQLFTLNSPFLQQQAAALAQRLEREAVGTERRIQRAYLLLFGRPATRVEVELGVEFLGTGRRGIIAVEKWREYAQVLLASNEFLFID